MAVIGDVGTYVNGCTEATLGKWSGNLAKCCLVCFCLLFGNRIIFGLSNLEVTRTFTFGMVVTFAHTTEALRLYDVFIVNEYRQDVLGQEHSNINLSILMLGSITSCCSGLPAAVRERSPRSFLAEGTPGFKTVSLYYLWMNRVKGTQTELIIAREFL